MQSLSAKSEAEICAAVTDAASAGKRFRIKGGGTRSSIGNPVSSDEVLDTSGNHGIEIYEPGSLHMVAKAGTSMTEIEKALKKENQMLAFEPMDHRMVLGSKGKPTIGGVVAGNVSGPRRFLAGACRDHLLGVRFVNGEGQVIKSGGRVMKNVTGLDLAKLQCGAFGTLGVLTEVSLKTLPKPETGVTLRVADSGIAEAVQIFSKALASPYEVSGAAWIDGSANLRLEGFEIQITARTEKMRALLSDFELEVVETGSGSSEWADIRDLKHLSQKAGTVWRISCLPTRAPQIIDTVSGQMDCQVSLDWGGGLIWLCSEHDTGNQAAIIRGVVAEHGGHATLIRGNDDLPADLEAFEPELPRLAELSAMLRKQFDPSGIFNPGIMAA